MADRSGSGIVPCRGRKDGLTTNVSGTFTELDLDAVQDLTPFDIKELSRYSNPPESVQAHIAARIQAAQLLKYGG